LRRLP
jgi:hypothetical protein